MAMTLAKAGWVSLFLGMNEFIFLNFRILHRAAAYKNKAYPVVPGFAGMGLVPAA
jgi:hypothetical protein